MCVFLLSNSLKWSLLCIEKERTRERERKKRTSEIFFFLLLIANGTKG